MKIELRHVVLYAIAPAVLTGVLSVAPKFYEVFFETRTSLEYTLSPSTPVPGDGPAQQVVSLRVANTGKKPLTAVTAELKVHGSTVTSTSIQNTTGIALDAKHSGDKVVVQLPKLLPSEEFAVAALLKSENPFGPPQVILRSDEVLGHRSAAAKVSQNDFWASTLGALGAASAVLLMALAGLLKFPGVFKTEKRASIMYITLACKNNLFTGTVLKRGEELSFMEFADLLLAFGRTADDARRPAMCGLQCLLAIDAMAPASRALVQRNLDQLRTNGDPPIAPADRTFKASGDGHLAFRAFVDEIFGLAPKATPAAS